MNPLFRNQKLNPLFAGLAFLSAISLHSNAQNENNFLIPSHQKPIRDHSVAPADFQQELDQSLPEVANKLFHDGEVSEQLSALAPTETEKSPGISSSLFDDLARQTNGVQIPKVFGSLAIVIGGYLGFVWLTRRIGGNSQSGLPTEVVEVLGQTPFGQRKNLQLVRLGSKLLLLMNNHDGSTQTIGEITDPHEVDYLTSICGNKTNSRSAIAISKATSSTSRNESTGSELTRVLRQLQKAGESNGASTVFDA